MSALFEFVPDEPMPELGIISVDLADLGEQHGVVTLTRRQWRLLPLVERRRVEPQHLGASDDRYPLSLGEPVDEGVHPSAVIPFAKNAAARRSISSASSSTCTMRLSSRRSSFSASI